MRGRLVLAVVSALVAAPSASAANDLTLDWSVADRLQGPATIDEAAPAKALAVRADVDVDGPCPTNPAFELDGAHVDATPSRPCGFNLAAVEPGHHELTLTAGDQHASTDIDLRDLLVVSIGDSVASGEGNPDAAGPTWLDDRCHRSLRSGAAQAARAVELGDRHSAVSLVPLGCSGATVDSGLLHPYGGIDPDPEKGPLKPQVDVLAGLTRPIDALLVNIGANDVNFGALVRFCVFAKDCPSRHFDPDHPAREAPDSVPTASQVEGAALQRLGARYDALAERLKGRVDPAKVIVVEYFDPLRDRHGDPCGHALPGVDVDEAKWAQRNVLAPLNTEVRAAAARHGWQVVGGVAEAFRRHGICAGGQSWITMPAESALRELAIEGTLHPNANGHIATATLIAPVLAGTLGVGPGAEQLIGTSHEGYVRWWWLLIAAVGGAGVALAVRRLLS